MSISFTDPVQQMAQIQVPGRSTGPVIQNLGTISVPSVQIQMDVQMPRKLVIESDHPDYVTYSQIRSAVETKMLGYRDDAINATLIWVTSDNENWNPLTGKYSRTVQWSYQATCS